MHAASDITQSLGKDDVGETFNIIRSMVFAPVSTARELAEQPLPIAAGIIAVLSCLIQGAAVTGVLRFLIGRLTFGILGSLPFATTESIFWHTFFAAAFSIVGLTFGVFLFQPKLGEKQSFGCAFSVASASTVPLAIAMILSLVLAHIWIPLVIAGFAIGYTSMILCIHSGAWPVSGQDDSKLYAAVVVYLIMLFFFFIGAKI
jgi:hypothetical protein